MTPNQIRELTCALSTQISVHGRLYSGMLRGHHYTAVIFWKAESDGLGQTDEVRFIRPALDADYFGQQDSYALQWRSES